MRRILVLIMPLLLFVLFPTQTQGLSPKVNAKCSTPNKVITANAIKLVCAKSGKRLVWKVFLSKKLSTKSDHASPVATSSPSPTLEEAPPKIALVQDLPVYYRFIKYWSWKKAWEEIESNPENSSSIEILVGPNSKVCFHDQTLKALRLLQRTYADVKLPSKLWLIYVDLDADRSWAESTTAALLPPERIERNSNGLMVAIESVNKAGEGVLWAENSCRPRSGNTFSSEVLHAYTHVIQDFQYFEDPNNQRGWGGVPRWLIEGAASWSQAFYNERDSLKRFERSGEWSALRSYDKKFFQDYLLIPKYSDNLWSYTDQWPSKRAYDLGSYVCDMLVALRGPASIIRLNNEYIVTGSFDRSFEKVYGLPWSEAQPYFSEAAYLLIQWVADPANRS